MSLGDTLRVGLARRAAAAATDDRSARVSALVDLEAGDLLDYFLRRTRTADDAADLLGETLLVVWRRERSIPEHPTEARMWMFGVARKVLAGHHRSTARHALLTSRLAATVTLESPPPPPGEDDELRGLIEQLDELDQEIIKLVYWDGFSLVDAAAVLRMRPATVRSRHARARTRLRAAINAQTTE